MDEQVNHTSDIGVSVTSDVKKIKSFLRGECSKVIFSTYQSSLLIAEAQKERKTPAFNLVLAVMRWAIEWLGGLVGGCGYLYVPVG